MTNLFIKKKWIKFIPSGFCYIKNKNIGSFTNGKHIGREIINWNKLWFYLQYQLNVLKNIIDIFSNSLFVTDYINIIFFVKILALKTKNFFMVGPWKGGYLTSIKWYKFLPSFIFNFGMLFKRNFYNEIVILGIPTISFTNITLSNTKSLAINYIIPFQNIDSIILRHICLLFIFISKKFNNFHTYLFNNKESMYSFSFFDKIKNIFNKTLYYKKKIKNYFFLNFDYFLFFQKSNKFNMLSSILFYFSQNLNLFFTYRKFISPFFSKYKFINNKLFFLQKVIYKNNKVFINKNLSFNFMNKKIYLQKIDTWLKNENLFFNLV